MQTVRFMLIYYLLEKPELPQDASSSNFFEFESVSHKFLKEFLGRSCENVSVKSVADFRFVHGVRLGAEAPLRRTLLAECPSELVLSAEAGERPRTALVLH